MRTSLFGTAVHAVLRSGEIASGAIAGRLRDRAVEVASCVDVAPSLEDVFIDVAEEPAA